MSSAREGSGMRRQRDYQAEHHELQAILVRELRTYPDQPMSEDEADTVAWHLADVTLEVVINAVQRHTTGG